MAENALVLDISLIIHNLINYAYSEMGDAAQTILQPYTNFRAHSPHVIYPTHPLLLCSITENGQESAKSKKKHRYIQT